jgi:hypothetical protein
MLTVRPYCRAAGRVLHRASVPDATDSDRHWLLAAGPCSPARKATLSWALHRCYSPRPVTLAELAEGDGKPFTQLVRRDAN